MLKKWYCQADVTLRITPIDPILVKSGVAQVTGADMHPVAMRNSASSEAYYIPGTSLKGVLRSHLERIGRTLAPSSVCIPYYDPDKARIRDSIAVADQQHSFGCSYLLGATQSKPATYRMACPVCRIFGLLGFAGRIAIADAIEVDNHRPKKEPRDGVGIDRFTGGSAQGVLFNQEVLVGGIYETTIRLTNFELWQLSALMHLLMDMKDAMLQVGSGRSRSLGRFSAEPASFGLTYLRRPGAETSNQLRGLFDMESAAVQQEYGLLTWAPDPIVTLPQSINRGLRVTYDILADWEAKASALSDGYGVALDQYATLEDITNQRRKYATAHHIG